MLKSSNLSLLYFALSKNSVLADKPHSPNVDVVCVSNKITVPTGPSTSADNDQVMPALRFHLRNEKNGVNSKSSDIIVAGVKPVCMSIDSIESEQTHNVNSNGDPIDVVIQSSRTNSNDSQNFEKHMITTVTADEKVYYNNSNSVKLFQNSISKNKGSNFSTNKKHHAAWYECFSTPPKSNFPSCIITHYGEYIVTPPAPDNDEKTCRVLALSGGGDKGAYEAGVVYGLVNNLTDKDAYKWDVVTGISAGSINAGAIGMFKLGDEKRMADFLLNTARNLHPNDIYRDWFDRMVDNILNHYIFKIIAPKWLRKIISSVVEHILPNFVSHIMRMLCGAVYGFFYEPGLFDTMPLLDFLRTQLGPLDAARQKFDPVTELRKLAIGASSYNTGDLVVWDEKLDFNDLTLAIKASASIPGVFETTYIPLSMVEKGKSLDDTNYNINNPFKDISIADNVTHTDTMPAAGQIFGDGGIKQGINILSGISRCLSADSDTDTQNKNHHPKVKPENIIVDVVMCDGSDINPVHQISDQVLTVLMRALDITRYKSSMDRVDEAKRFFPQVNFRYIIAPTKALPSKTGIEFATKALYEMTEIGIADAKNAIGMMSMGESEKDGKLTSVESSSSGVGEQRVEELYV